MKQYIDKAAVVAEIKKIYNEDYKFLPSDIVENIQDFKDDILINIDTLEVKEVDLEREVNSYMVNEMKFLSDEVGYDTLLAIAQHFFELGINTRKI